MVKVLDLQDQWAIPDTLELTIVYAMRIRNESFAEFHCRVYRRRPFFCR